MNTLSTTCKKGTDETNKGLEIVDKDKSDITWVHEALDANSHIMQNVLFMQAQHTTYLNVTRTRAKRLTAGSLTTSHSCLYASTMLPDSSGLFTSPSTASHKHSSVTPTGLLEGQ